MNTLRGYLLLLAMVIGGSLFAQSQKELGDLMLNRGEYYFTLSVNDPTEIQAISDLCSVDGTDGRIVVCYANKKQYDRLLQAGYEPNLQTPPSLREEAKMWVGGDRASYAWDSYPTYSQYEAMMQSFPSSVVSGRNCAYLELGTLSSGRKIMGVRINNGDAAGKPKFLYSSTIHGDETTGWILLLRLIDELCTSTDSRIVNLVNNLDIFIFPNANPDGTYYGGNNTVNSARRANANNVDMNRNYPDPHSSAHPDGNAYQTETQWFMQLAEDYAFTMAANFHGGSEVMNYPWDNTYALHPDDAWWQHISREYANLAQAVSSSYMTDEDNGVTNGAQWYMIGGGRQDYMNAYRQCREITIECSTTKKPSGSQLPDFWNYNHNAMLAFMEQCLNGIHGFVYDAYTNQPINGATVTVLNHDDQYSYVSSHEEGDFHRPIKGGTWTLEVAKAGYCTETISVTIADGHRVELEVYLTPEGNCAAASVTTNCFEQVLPNDVGNYVMGYLNGTSLIQPMINNSSTVTTISNTVTPYGNGFTVESTSAPGMVTLSPKGSNGQYYISYNGHFLARNYYNNLTWSTNPSNNGLWYIKSSGIYVVQNSTKYYLYYDVNSDTFKITNSSSSNQNNVKFFMQDECPLPEFTKDVTCYLGEQDHYCLLASPIGTVSPSDVDDMLSNEYDFYWFDQTQGLEWINFEGDNGGFDLAPGKGYLYANSEDVTLTFTGYPYFGSARVTLIKNGNAHFPGWNLVGNPFARVSYIDRPFYRMNQAGTDIAPATGAIAAMEGVFVIADEDGEDLVFNASEQNDKSSALLLNLACNRGGTLDHAIVRFDNGGELPKFQLNPNNTKVYFPQDHEDFAVINAGENGELPVNFKAATNGIYTISVSAQEVGFRYLHLIDNLTGIDVDLLSTPSYTFEANVADMECRFKLVLVCGNASANNDFAFFSNGSWIVDNEGSAVLQVIDMQGRILSSEQIEDCISKHINAVSGIYLFRLVKGEDVKVQKVVVR